MADPMTNKLMTPAPGTDLGAMEPDMEPTGALGSLKQGVDHLNRHTERGEHAPMVGGHSMGHKIDPLCTPSMGDDCDGD